MNLQSSKTDKKISIVFSGGGARGAYEAGVIHYIRTQLAKEYRNRRFDIHTGASVGAINAAFTASTAHDLEYQGKQIFNIWSDLKEEKIYHRNTKAMFSFIGSSTKGIVSNLFFGAQKSKSHFKSLLDTTPFQSLLKEVIDWKQIHKNVSSKAIQAVALVVTNIFSGQAELFIDKHSDIKYTGVYPIHVGPLEPTYALASAAIPIVFPTVMIDGIAYSDGGIRLNTPMSPAIQLGADAILIINSHYKRPIDTPIPVWGKKGVKPTTGQILSRLMNSLFLDRIQYDIEQLERINRIIDWCELKYGDTFLDELNNLLKEKNIKGDIANRGLKRIQVLEIQPSKDLGELFKECYEKEKSGHFTAFEKLLTRVLDVDPDSGFDFLSYITFLPHYIKNLLELGFEDAKKNHNQLEEFLSQ